METDSDKENLTMGFCEFSEEYHRKSVELVTVGSSGKARYHSERNEYVPKKKMLSWIIFKHFK